MKAVHAVTLILLLALVAWLAALVGGDEAAVTLYQADIELPEKEWRRGELPDDRWIGFVLDQQGFERLQSEVSAPVGALRDAPDFAREILFLAYLGRMPTGGHGIAVREIHYIPEGDRGRLSVRIHAFSPGPGDFVTQALTYPAEALRLERADWPKEALDGLADGSLSLEVLDQNGRDWGPVRTLPNVRGNR